MLILWFFVALLLCAVVSSESSAFAPDITANGKSVKDLPVFKPDMSERDNFFLEGGSVDRAKGSDVNSFAALNSETTFEVAHPASYRKFNFVATLLLSYDLSSFQLSSKSAPWPSNVCSSPAGY